VWLCFFIGLNIIISIMLGSIAVLTDDYTESIKDAFKEDIKDTRNFKHTITLKFNTLAKCLIDEKYSDMIEAAGVNLSSEGENLIYYAENLKTGMKLTNSKTNLGISVKDTPSIPKGYDYYLYFNGDKFFVENNGKKFDIYGKDIGYSNLKYWGYLSEDINEKIPELKECRIFLIVKEEIEKDISGTSNLYQIKREMQITKWIFVSIIAIFLLGLILLIISIINRKLKQEFDKQIAKFLGKFWLEVKAIMSLVVLIMFVVGLNNNRNRSSINELSLLLFTIFILLIVGWWFYLMLVDFIMNKKKFFSNNSINSLIRVYRSLENKKPFQKGMILRLYVLIGVETILVFFAGVSGIILFSNGDGLFFFSFLIISAIGVYLIYRYVRRYNVTVTDIGKLVDQIKAVKNGDIKTGLTIHPDADMYNAAQNLSKIQEGMGRAVEEKIKSERTKIELITNVSHDLKTPLTSIISYVDLLSKEEGLPEHVNDYIKVLQQKSDRLKTLIEDLFDLAKAASGEIKIDYEKLDLGKLVQQTLADLDEEISQSGLGFKVNIPEQPTFIMSDGKKLYRIFLNLISNALKYSLVGSRVYIDLVIGSGNEDGNGNEDAAANDATIANGDTIPNNVVIVNENTTAEVTAIIKNTANYEMNFNKDEILERFVRGDEARSSEGSGLGLAIAQSFTHACGGKFDIIIDGDMFKVMLTFDVIN